MKTEFPLSGSPLPALCLTLAFFFCILTPGLPYAEERQFERNTLFEGLHVTGSPVDIDIATFRLSVGGKVDRDLSLSFDDIMALATVDKRLVLECPGFFTDVGVWTGVPVRTILDLAGVQQGADTVRFISADNIYKTRIPLADVRASQEILVAYRFNGKPFHRVHGFPIRLTAGGREGSDWVKWLGSILVD